jgi:3' terminal RNA ribose 2'-O-methyltransferase Hen1
LEKGKDWLPAHPALELITRRYLKHQTGLTNKALSVLSHDEGEEDAEEREAEPEHKQRAHDLRLLAVRDELINTDAKRIVDLGCGEGKLLKLLLAQKQFEFLLGMDVSYRSLEIAKEKLKTDRLSPRQQQRIQLIQGSLTYQDKRIAGFDAAALVEVIEHLDEPRLVALEKSVFQFARPTTVVITTPNAEYNQLFTDYQEGQMRHSDHRFEWTRAEFEAWGNRIASTYRYVVVYKPVGEEQPEVGALSQMGIFTISN